MFELTYQLISGGYQILLDGRLYIDQPFAPGEEGKRPMGAEEAEQRAAETIAALTETLRAS